MKRLALLLLLATLTGCGGSSTGGSGKVDKAAYIGKAEVICTAAVAKQKALKAPASVDALAPYVNDVVGVAVQATKDLSALTPPAGDRAALQEKFLGPLEAQARDAERYAADVTAASKQNDQAALGRLALSPPTKPKADLDYLRKYGFTSCVDAADTSN